MGQSAACTSVIGEKPKDMLSREGSLTHGALRRACRPVPDSSAEGRAWLVSQQEWAWRTCGRHRPRQRGLSRKTWDREQHCGGLGSSRMGSRLEGQAVGRGTAPSGRALLALTTGDPHPLLPRVIKRRLHHSTLAKTGPDMPSGTHSDAQVSRAAPCQGPSLRPLTPGTPAGHSGQLLSTRYLCPLPGVTTR